MEYIKGYTVTVLAVVLFSSLCEMLLPEGSMKKYAASLIGLAVMAAVISPLARLTKTSLDNYDLLSEPTITSNESDYQRKLAREYENRIAAVILERGNNIVCSVLVNPEDMKIKKVYIKGTYDEELINFIINELGVLKDDIEIIR